jgi:hypothetical protein
VMGASPDSSAITASSDLGGSHGEGGCARGRGLLYRVEEGGSVERGRRRRGGAGSC